MKNYKKISINLILLIELYLVFTVVYCIYGPIKWYLKNQGIVIVLIAIYQISLLIGYIIGNKTTTKKQIYDYKDTNNGIKFATYISIFNAIATSIRIIGSFSIKTIFQNIINGIIVPSYQYNLLFTNYASVPASKLLGGKLLSLVITIGGPFTIYSIILSIVYYKKIKFKSIVFINILFTIFQKLIAGANEGIFDIGIYIFIGIVIRFFIDKKRKYKKGQLLKLTIVGIIILIIILSFFNNNEIGRSKGNFIFGPIGENHFNYDSPILKLIPKKLYFLFGYISVYLCQGYYGFSLTTLVKWKPNFFTGFSPFIRDNLLELFNINLFRNTYQNRVSIYNWGAMQNFHSAYTFWANDLTLYGVPIAMLLIGYLLAKTQQEIIINENPYAISIFTLLIILVIYMPANNKIFVQPSSFILFFSCLILWFLKGKNLHYHKGI